VQQKIERGDKIYRWDRNSLEYWERLTIELSRLQSTGL
jgi:hypothetical protein